MAQQTAGLLLPGQHLVGCPQAAAHVTYGEKPCLHNHNLSFASPGKEHPCVCLHLYVQDVDQQFTQAIKAGGTAISKPKDQFYGDRSGMLKDPFGHVWFLATRKEDLTEAQVRQRAEAMFKQG